MSARKGKTGNEPVSTDTENAVAEPVLGGDGVGQVDDQSNPGQKKLQEIVDEAEERGHYGVAVDRTPNENYTVSGVLSGAEVPETVERRS